MIAKNSVVITTQGQWIAPAGVTLAYVENVGYGGSGTIINPGGKMWCRVSW